MMDQPSAVTRDTSRAVRIVCSGERTRAALRPLTHRRSRRHVRTRLHDVMTGSRDYDALVFEPKRLTGWDIA